MDWKQFVASIVGSLAWPTVVVVLLLILRKQLTGLAMRLLKLSLPGGVEASFGEGLEKSRDTVEEIVVKEPTRAEPEKLENKPDERRLELARNFPEASVNDSFKEVERALLRFTDQFPMKGNLSGLVSVLAQNEIIDPSVVDLYNQLRSLRNLASHGYRGDFSISSGEAIEYAEQAHVLAGILNKAYDQNASRRRS